MRTGFHVEDKKGESHQVMYRDYHLLTPLWKSLSMESLAVVERLRAALSTPGRVINFKQAQRKVKRVPRVA